MRKTLVTIAIAWMSGIFFSSCGNNSQAEQAPSTTATDSAKPVVVVEEKETTVDTVVPAQLIAVSENIQEETNTDEQFKNHQKFLTMQYTVHIWLDSSKKEEEIQARVIASDHFTNQGEGATDSIHVTHFDRDRFKKLYAELLSAKPNELHANVRMTRYKGNISYMLLSIIRPAKPQERIGNKMKEAIPEETIWYDHGSDFFDPKTNNESSGG